MTRPVRLIKPVDAVPPHDDAAPPKVANDNPDECPLTRREAAEFLTARGFRISTSNLAKLCSPAIGGGPPSCGRWGRDCLYLPSELLAWAKRRMQSGGGANRAAA
jgi:hypothetical protein